MNHIDNISALFSANFVAHPLLESFDAGSIILPTGKLVACDPLLSKEMPAFSDIFPAGEFPLLVHREKESNCIAYSEIIFSDAAVQKWQMATLPGQNTAELKDGEIFGYPVQSGMGCYMDEETQECLNVLENRLFHRKGADFMGLYEEFFHSHFFDENGAIDQFALLKPDEERKGNIFAFETGYGEGFYATYIGYDANNTPAKLVTEFIEIQN